jgi:hypothetical protein
MCIPSSIEIMHMALFPVHVCAAFTFEWRSCLRKMDPECFDVRSGLRFLCVPASLESFTGTLAGPSSSLEVLTFESPVDCGDGADLFGDITCLVGAGNRHFAVFGCLLMNYARTSLIRYCDDSEDDITLDSTVEELGYGCCLGMEMRTFTFAEPSRLRIIGERAFDECQNLSLIVIPASVEEIGDMAFHSCHALQEVRFATGSRLQLIGPASFLGCGLLQPVDVPACATNQGNFTVLATVYDVDGAERKRVEFIHEIRLC